MYGFEALCGSGLGNTINSLGFINVNSARRMLEEHLNEERNWQHQLWTLLMLLAWIDHNK